VLKTGRASAESASASSAIAWLRTASTVRRSRRSSARVGRRFLSS
jgi:hypothetical protein